jgi:hypothetical protein
MKIELNAAQRLVEATEKKTPARKTPEKTPAKKPSTKRGHEKWLRMQKNRTD